MSSLKKRTYKNKSGESVFWVFSYYKDGVRHRKNFKRKPTLDEMAAISKTSQKNPYFINAIEDYINACSLHCKDSTIETYKNYKNVALSDLHYKRIKALDRNEMSKFFVELKTKKAPKTYNNI